MSSLGVILAALSYRIKRNVHKGQVVHEQVFSGKWVPLLRQVLE